MADEKTIQALAPMPGEEVHRECEALYTLILREGDIVDDDDYKRRLERLKTIKGKQGTIGGWRDRLLKPFKEGVDGIRNFFAAPLTLLDRVEDLEKSRLTTYAIAKEKAARAEQEAAYRAAEKERQRLAEQAQRAEAKGHHDKAANLEERAAATVAPIIVPQIEKVSGAVYREVWTFVIEDESKIPRDYLKVDEQKIRRQVNATRATTRIAGVRVYKDKQLAVRGT
jgi:hypothetical protein